MKSSASTQAFIAFLRCEAQQAEERAKSLRATAAAIEANAASEWSRRKKSKKEGGKSKRADTGYTLYVRENYENVKQMHGGEGVSSKAFLAILAQQWSQIDESELQAWQQKAEELKQTESQSLDESLYTLEPGDIDVPDQVAEVWRTRKRPAKKLPTKDAKRSTAAV